MIRLQVRRTTKKGGHELYEIDPSVAFDLAAAGVAAFAGPAGIASALGSLANVVRGIKKRGSPHNDVAQQAIALYVLSLVGGTCELLKERAPGFPIEEQTKVEISTVVSSALNAAELQISWKAIEQPSLNPGFVRYREKIASLLKRVDTDTIEPGEIEAISRGLGARFSQVCAALLVSIEGNQSLAALADYLQASRALDSDSRIELWSSYEAHLNDLVFKNLFLHELEGHPDVTLPDIYVPSRGIFIERIDPEDDLESRNRGDHIESDEDHVSNVHCFDLKDKLISGWLRQDAKKVGNSRLVTGDPGTGKSTFSLMFAQSLAKSGSRVVYIPANSIRSFGASLEEIVVKHLTLTLGLSQPPSIEVELTDPSMTGEPLLIIIDGLDEYDVGDTTVALAAARLVEHAQKTVDDWHRHNRDVRLLLCGRPEAAASLSAQFRAKFHHLHVTGFVHSLAHGQKAADTKSEKELKIDQRDIWWRKWQELGNEAIEGLPKSISESEDEGVLEITAQPLLNYMIAVLHLHENDRMSSLSTLYSDLFSKYYERQSEGKFAAFCDVCPSLDRFRRIMSEIGLAAWHAGDRSVGTSDLEARFNRPPLKRWLESAGEAGRGLSAILSAFYTRPDESATPEKGLAHRYVFTHKSFREYLTAVGIVRFLRELAQRLHPDAEDGWADESALLEWLKLFGPTPIDQRQWDFIEDELRVECQGSEKHRILGALVHLFQCVIRREMPLPPGEAATQVYRMVGNAEEALIVLIDATLQSFAYDTDQDRDASTVEIAWDETEGSEGSRFEFFELLHRIRARPGCPDEMLMYHIKGILAISSRSLRAQMATRFRNRPDSYSYAFCIDLSGALLENVDLSASSLRYSRFHRAQLVECDLRDADISELNLSHGTLTGCDLEGAQVDGIYLTGVDLEPGGPSMGNRSGPEEEETRRIARKWFKAQGARYYRDSEED